MIDPVDSRHIGSRMPLDLTHFDPQPIANSQPGLQIGNRLGVGGQKAVWRCSYEGHNYVLKVLVADPGTIERAKRELEVYRLCTSPFLPRIGPLPLANLQVGPDTSDSVIFYLEQLIEGNAVNQLPKR